MGHVQFSLWHVLYFSATGLDPSGLISTPTTPIQSIDLLAALGLFNNSWPGATITVGPQPLKPAYALQGNSFLFLIPICNLCENGKNRRMYEKAPLNHVLGIVCQKQIL